MRIVAPFTLEQIQVLNERQCHVDGGMPMHPFTCPNRSDGISYDGHGHSNYSQATHGWDGGDLGLLIATEEGWVCPYCAYRQGFAYAAMVEFPVPADRIFHGFPTIAGICGQVRRETLLRLIEGYRALATAGKPGAETMLLCLMHRQAKLKEG